MKAIRLLFADWVIYFGYKLMPGGEEKEWMRESLAIFGRHILKRYETRQHKS